MVGFKVQFFSGNSDRITFQSKIVDTKNSDKQSMSVSQVFALAIQHHQARHLSEAEACCKKILVPQGSVKNSPTVDRIDTTKGYELNNIWVICFQCNQTKGQHRFPDILYKIADAWYFKLKEKVKKLCK